MNFSDPLGLLADCKTEGKPCQQDLVPSKIVILNPRPQFGRTAFFFYQVENKEGQGLSGVAVKEHLWSDRAHHRHYPMDNTSENAWIPGPRVRDKVGGFIHNTRWYQTFTVRYGGGDTTTLSTEFEHTAYIDNENRWVNTIKDIRP